MTIGKLVGALNVLNKNWVKMVFMSFLLILPILWFSGPIISLGTDNSQMIRHFDNDESYIVNSALKTYSQGIVPLQWGAAYPQFFYYVAGIVLFPFTKLHGVNPQAIIIGLRCLNVLVALMTILFLYYFVLKYTKSIGLAVLSSVLLMTTPNYLEFAVNSRPHLMSAFLILISIYFCFRMVDDYQPKYYWGAIVFSALSMATNYFGLFLIPAIWAAGLYNMAQEPSAALIASVKAKARTIYLLSRGIVLCVLSGIAAASYLLFKYQHLLYRTKIKGLGDFLHIRPVRLLIVVLSFVLLAGAVWVWIDRICRRRASDQALSPSARSFLIINKGFLLFFSIIASVFFIFLIINPAYWMFPMTTTKIVVKHIILTTMGTSVDVGLSAPLFDPGRLVWFKLLFETELLGSWLGILFGGVILFEAVRLKRNWGQDRRFTFQRILLWIFSLSLFCVLVFFVSHRPYHYLFPIVLAVICLISFAGQQIIRQSRTKIPTRLLLAFFGLLLALGIYTRWVEVVNNRNIHLSNVNDTGLTVGKWLEDNYSAEKIIWKDNDTYYIPPKFKSVLFSEDQANYDIIKEINKTKPEILVISNAWDNSLKNTERINQAIKNGAIKGFRLANKFMYKGAMALGASDRGKHKEILIYTK